MQAVPHIWAVKQAKDGDLLEGERATGRGGQKGEISQPLVPRVVLSPEIAGVNKLVW
jgi:hypothetical protein